MLEPLKAPAKAVYSMINLNDRAPINLNERTKGDTILLDDPNRDDMFHFRNGVEHSGRKSLLHIDNIIG